MSDHLVIVHERRRFQGWRWERVMSNGVVRERSAKRYATKWSAKRGAKRAHPALELGQVSIEWLVVVVLLLLILLQLRGWL